jgi:two-component system nitrate/nitrite response regulator NarL
MIREGLKHILSQTRFKVHPEDLSRGDAALLDQVDEPILFIVDASLYPQGLDDVLPSLKDVSPDARVVVLADEFSLSAMMAALQAGADGYCLATTGCEALVRYLDLVMLGEIVFPSAMLLAALSSGSEAMDMHRKTATGQMRMLQSSAPVAEGQTSPVRNLSSREAEILQCLTQGAPNKVIARKLDVAEATVKVHIKAILRKIRVANRTQAAMWAVNHLPASEADHSAVPMK